MSLMHPSHQKQSASRRYERSPGGLLLPLHATVKGRTRWQVLDERGVPEVPRTPSGIPVAPVEGVEHDNLLTDVGLDNIGIRSLHGSGVAGTNQIRGYLAVGTGSTAPAFSDTELDNEVQRAGTSGSFTAEERTYTWVNAGGADYLDAQLRARRLVTMTDDRNLTEYGLFGASSGGDMNIRELLRDGGGTPITVSLLNTKSLLLTHDFLFEIAAPDAGATATIDIEEYDAGDNLVNTIVQDVRYGFFSHTATRPSEGIFRTWEPGSTTNAGTGSSNQTIAGLRLSDDVPYSMASGPAAGSWSGQGNQHLVSRPVYVTGSHERIKRFSFDSGAQTGVWYGCGTAGRNTFNNFFYANGWMMRFLDPASYTKAAGDSLRFGFVSTWARA